MTYLSRKDLRDMRAEAVAGTLFAPPQVICLLDEIDRLIGLYEDLRQELDKRILLDRRSEPREAVMGQVLENIEGFTKSVSKEGA